MHLTVIFESWLLGDGVYPSLRRGQTVNLAFEFQPCSSRSAPRGGALSLTTTGPGEYRAIAEVLFVYQDPRGGPTPVVAATSGEFAFYFSDPRAPTVTPGDRLELEGTLLVDYYYWSETICHAAGAPDLFHTFELTSLARVQIPERLISRSASGSSGPARVGPEDWDPGSVREVADMDDEPDTTYYFYLLTLDDTRVRGRAVPRTFISA